MITKVHCLFEQSGTFKNELKKLGYDAEDYDIQNEFGETDHVVDLFSEIRSAYDGKRSIFDDIKKDDLVLAFFPCTRFEAQIQLWFSGNNFGEKTWSDQQKLLYAMDLHNELNEMYELISKLFMLSYRGGWKMIVENPYTQPHYLTLYFPVKPKYIDKDRQLNGDFYKKPTQYWFINCDPKNNFVLEPRTLRNAKQICDERNKTERSMMSKEYARRFILQHSGEDPIDGVVIVPG